MTITHESRDFTPAEKYLMTKSPSMLIVKKLPDDSTLKVEGFITYEDQNNKDETSFMMSILGTDINGERAVWTTQSKTFKDSFLDIYSIFEGQEFSIRKLSGTTANGRGYVNCDLVF